MTPLFTEIFAQRYKNLHIAFWGVFKDNKIYFQIGSTFIKDEYYSRVARKAKNWGLQCIRVQFDLVCVCSMVGVFCVCVCV